MKRRYCLWAMAATLTSFLVGSPLGSTASAEPLGCGTVITRNTVLQNDIGPCVGDGIIIGADRVTLDLGRHRIFGTSGPQEGFGIRISDRRGARVRGGTVTDFGTGVAIFGGANNIVTGVVVTDNIGPLDQSGDSGAGIDIFDSSNNVLLGNKVVHNGPFEGIGVFGTSSRGNRIVRNLIADNNIKTERFGTTADLDDGINLGFGLEGGSGTTIEGNAIQRNGQDGINACSQQGAPCLTTDNIIVRNLVEGNGLGFQGGNGINVVSIVPDDDSDPFNNESRPITRNRVVGNRVLNNADFGIAVGTQKNQILSNVAFGNGDGRFYTDLGDFTGGAPCPPRGPCFPELPPCDSNVWRGNKFGTAQPDCIYLQQGLTPPPPPPPLPPPNGCGPSGTDPCQPGEFPTPELPPPGIAQAGSAASSASEQAPVPLPPPRRRPSP